MLISLQNASRFPNFPGNWLKLFNSIIIADDDPFLFASAIRVKSKNLKFNPNVAARDKEKSGAAVRARSSKKKRLRVRNNNSARQRRRGNIKAKVCRHRGTLYSIPRRQRRQTSGRAHHVSAVRAHQHKHSERRANSETTSDSRQCWKMAKPVKGANFGGFTMDLPREFLEISCVIHKVIQIGSGNTALPK